MSKIPSIQTVLDFADAVREAKTLAERATSLENAVAEAEDRLAKLRLEDSGIRTALSYAKLQAEALCQDSKEEATRVKTDARLDLETIKKAAQKQIDDAKVEANRILNAAYAEADQVLADIADEKVTVDQFRAEEARLRGAIDELKAKIRTV